MVLGRRPLYETRETIYETEFQRLTHVRKFPIGIDVSSSSGRSIYIPNVLFLAQIINQLSSYQNLYTDFCRYHIFALHSTKIILNKSFKCIEDQLLCIHSGPVIKLYRAALNSEVRESVTLLVPVAVNLNIWR
jgi:hypothetical protein